MRKMDKIDKTFAAAIVVVGAMVVYGWWLLIEYVAEVLSR
jgi:hypothetical protein